jgi:hypothetical protein
MDVILG